MLFVRDLTYTECQPKSSTNYSIMIQPFFNSLFILNYKSPDVELTIQNMFSSQGRAFNETIPAKISEFAGLGLRAIIPAGSTFAFTTLGYRNTLCKGPIEIITEPQFEQQLLFRDSDIPSDGYEKCILHAPAGTGIQYEVSDTDLGNAMLSVFDDHDPSLPIDSFYDKYQSSWSTSSDHPLLYRLKLDFPDGKETHSVTLKSKVLNSRSDAIIYHGYPESFNSTTFGSISHRAIFPIIGCIPAILLLFAWCISFCILSRKPVPSKPVQINIDLP